MTTAALFPPSILFGALLVMNTLAPMNSTAQSTADHVTIRGQVLADDNSGNGSLEVVEVDNRVCVPLEVQQNGRFELVLEAGNKAYLRFEKEGYLTKEVLVDTRNANITREAAKKNKMLRFAVQMTPAPADKKLHYAGPVGVIRFLNGTGFMKVRYDRSLTRSSNGDIACNAVD